MSCAFVTRQNGLESSDESESGVEVLESEGFGVEVLGIELKLVEEIQNIE